MFKQCSIIFKIIIMKMKLLYLWLLLSIMSLSIYSNAQTTLAPGDIAIFQNQTDTPDTFSFVTFVDLAANTGVYFTDCGVLSNGFFQSPCLEGAVKYTVPAGGITAGTIIRWDVDAVNPNFTVYRDSRIGGTGASMPLSTGGDSIIAFQDAASASGGTNAAANPRFIFIINNASTGFTGDPNNSTTETNLPSGLSETGLPRTALGLGKSAGNTDEWDNTLYNGTYDFSGSGIAGAKIAMTNPANYFKNDSRFDMAYDNAAASVPASLILTATCTDPDVPSLTSSPSTVCAGSSATINISGSLNDATAWHIYTGSCGGSPLGTTTTGSFVIPSVNVATTYFVRGEGGCVAPGTCGTITINPTAIDDASFSYSSASYCANGIDPSPTITGTSGGSFSSSFGLSINPSNGFIDLSTSTPGNYIITYTTSGVCPSSSNANITINAADDAGFSYSGFVYCVNGADVTPTITGTTGGVFTSSPSGLSLNSSTGEIDLSASISNFYQITYTTNGVCPTNSNQFVSISPADDASFSYSSSSYCVSDSDPSPTVTGLGGGSFTSGAGLSINGASGAIDVSASTPGTYTVTYTTAGSCPNSSNVSVTINALDDASFNYSSSSYCLDGADPSPTVTGLGGGSFTSGAGLSINGASGAIDVSASTPGTYTVTYTTAGSCPNSSNVSVTINALDDPSFSYSSSTYTTVDADPTPTITGVTGGIFSSTSGLSLNVSSGVIDLSASTPGSYNVTYTTSGACPNSSIQSLTIEESNDNLSGATSLTYGAGCTGSIYDIANATLEMGESVPDCAFDTGAPVVPANRSSQWYSFVASGSGDALIKITDDGINTFGPQSASIGLTLSLYGAPSVAGDVSTLSTPLACSSSSMAAGVELLDGTFIDAKGLTPGSTYYVQVYSNENTSISYCIDVSEPVIYTYNNGWQAPNGDPELVNNPFKRVEIVAGSAVQQPLANGGSPIPPSVGSLYVAQNASVSYDYLLLNYKMEIDGAVNPVLGPPVDPTFPAFITTNQSLSSVSGMGSANFNSFIYVNENANSNTVNVDLDIDVYYELQASDRSLNFLKKITLKSTADRTAVFTSQSFPPATSTSGSITGQVEVEQFIPENNSVRGRAYRFVSSPVASMSSIYEQWQENGASPSGYGTHITGTSGTVGAVDAATGFDQTSSGARSMRTYSNDTGQSFNVVTSTNQAADSLKIAQAYLLYIRGDRNVDLTSNTSSSATVLRSTGTLAHKPISNSYDVEQGDFIFTGNPYQSAVKVEDLIDSSSNIEDDVVYYWDPTLGGMTGSGGAYVTYTGFDGGGTGVATPASSNNGFIQPGQAVFLRANAGANGPTNDAVISYRPSQTDINGLVTGTSNTVTSTPSTGPASISMSLYDTASFTAGNSLSDGLLIRFGSNYTNTIGRGDYVKIMNFDESIAVEQVANNYAVAGRSMPVHNEVIQLNHYNYGDANYTYTIDLTGLTAVDVYIHDQYTNTSTPLTDGLNTYNFTVDTAIAGSIATDRFQLKFENVTLGIEDTLSGASFTMYPNPAATNEVISMQSSQLVSKQARLRVTDLSGKLISDRSIEFNAQGMYEWKDADLKTGLYILEVSTEAGDKLVRKLVIE